MFSLLSANLRRGLHLKLVALHPPRSLEALASQKLKAGGAPSPRSLRPRKRHPQQFYQQEKRSSRRNPHHCLRKPRLSRGQLLQKSPKRQQWKSWAKGSPSDPRHPRRWPKTQSRQRGAGPSDKSQRRRPIMSLQLKSQLPKVGPGSPNGWSHHPKSPQSKKRQRATSRPLVSPREGKTEAGERLQGLGHSESAAVCCFFQCSLSLYHCFLPF